MTLIKACPVCGSTDLVDLFATQDYSYSQQRFTLQECQQCHFRLTNPQPDSDTLPQYYQADDYISHTGKSKGVITTLYHGARKFNLHHKHKLISKFHPIGNLLDIGCGTGEFLAFMKQKNWQVHGVEPATTARQKAEELLNQPIYTQLPITSDKQYDVITLWHVLEHLPNLNQQLQQIKTLLKPHGLIFVAVPNYESTDASIYQQHWAAYDVPRHLWHFSKESMSKLLVNHQLQLKSVKAMPLDAFYISLLSETYRKTNPFLRYPKAVANALYSNWKFGQQPNSSGLLYIIGS